MTTTTSSSTSIINQAADTLLTPKTLSLSSHIPSVKYEQSDTENVSDLKKRSQYDSLEASQSKTDALESTLENNSSKRNITRTNNSSPVITNNDEHLASKKVDSHQQPTNKRVPNERTTTTVNGSIFEPVSPISDDQSKDEQPAAGEYCNRLLVLQPLSWSEVGQEVMQKFRKFN